MPAESSMAEPSLELMDPDLAQAAEYGDVRFLRNAATTNRSPDDYSYFLRITEMKGNIFHIAAWFQRFDFFMETMEHLPSQVIQLLLLQQMSYSEYYSGNPLHAAAHKGDYEIVNLILEFYKSLPHASASASDAWLANKPWLARDSRGRTPLHLALENYEGECAYVLLSMDVELLGNMDDNKGNSPLYLAVYHNCEKVALKILKSGHPYSVSGKNGQTPLHVAPCCTEDVCGLLIEKHPQFVKARDHEECTVMHSWVSLIKKYDKLWPFELLLLRDSNNIAPELRLDFLELILATDEEGSNPLHDTAMVGRAEVASILVGAYRRRGCGKLNVSFEGLVPWLRRNDNDETPLDMAIRNNYEEIAMCFLSWEINEVLDLNNNEDNNPLFLAITRKMYKVAEHIVMMQRECGWPGMNLASSGRPPNILHNSLKYKEEIAIWLVATLPNLVWEEDDDGKTPLQKAIDANATWLIKAMLSAREKERLPWVEACKKGDFKLVVAIIHHCSYFRDLCLELRETPLHYIHLRGGYHQYLDFLKIPMMLDFMNFQDSNGDTPLHLAIQNRNIHLTEVLLTMEDVNRIIKDKKGKTPLELLAQVCQKEKEWDEMCKRIGIIPLLRTTYFQDKINMLEVRNTLSVVAALLATITFTAGFTLPGGFDSDTGKAILGEKAGFLVFLLADTIAMCCSMLVLVLLIWSMVCDKNKSLVLIDRSIPLLMIALYSTLLAFMTGVYIVMPHRSLWAVIVVLVMCSIIIISSKRSFMLKVLDKLYPVKNGEYNDEIQLLEQGRTSTFEERSNSNHAEN